MALKLYQPMHFSDPGHSVRIADNSQLSSALRGLYVITDQALGGGHLAIAKAALRGGARIIQLRDKTTPVRPLLAVAHELRRLTREAGALFFINDRLDLALLCEADGVHLGPDDFPLVEVRRVVGRSLLLGASCGTPEEAVVAEREGADMIGIGAVYGTATKHDAGDAIGIEGLQRVMSATTLPTAAIGGIGRANIAPVVETDVPMVCVISAITGAGDEAQMEAATRELVEAVDRKFSF